MFPPSAILKSNGKLFFGARRVGRVAYAITGVVLDLDAQFSEFRHRGRLSSPPLMGGLPTNPKRKIQFS
jgi:hypothetical protein